MSCGAGVRTLVLIWAVSVGIRSVCLAPLRESKWDLYCCFYAYLLSGLFPLDRGFRCVFGFAHFRSSATKHTMCVDQYRFWKQLCGRMFDIGNSVEALSRLFVRRATNWTFSVEILFNSIFYLHSEKDPNLCYLKALYFVRWRPCDAVEETNSSHNEPCTRGPWMEKPALTFSVASMLMLCHSFCVTSFLCLWGMFIVRWIWGPVLQCMQEWNGYSFHLNLQQDLLLFSFLIIINTMYDDTALIKLKINPACAHFPCCWKNKGLSYLIVHVGLS